MSVTSTVSLQLTEIRTFATHSSQLLSDCGVILKHGGRRWTGRLKTSLAVATGDLGSQLPTIANIPGRYGDCLGQGLSSQRRARGGGVSKLSERNIDHCESSVVLHPPDDAVTAELVHGPHSSTVSYRPNGSTDHIDTNDLRTGLGGDLRAEQVTAYIEGRLEAAGRTTLDCQAENGAGGTVVAVWTLALPPPR